MRIITGSARGIGLLSPEGEETRPTADRVKEALFSMIQFETEGRRVLDLFGGSGQLGLEALSRGAASCTLTDSSRDAVDIIMKNAKKTGLFDRCRISNVDFKAFLRSAAGKEKYDLIFLDPPYASDCMAQALKLIDEGQLLAAGGKIICETDNGPVTGKRKKSKDEDAAAAEAQVFGGDAELSDSFVIFRTAVYGRTRITLLENAKGE